MEDNKKDKEIRDAFINIDWGLDAIVSGVNTLRKYIDSKKGKEDILHIYDELLKIDHKRDDLKKILKY